MTTKRNVQKVQPPGDVPSMMTALLHIHAAPTRAALADAIAGACEQIDGAQHAFIFFEREDGMLLYRPPASEPRRRSHGRAIQELGAELLTRAVDANDVSVLAEALDSDTVVAAPVASVFTLRSSGRSAPTDQTTATTRAFAAAITGAGDRYGALLVLGTEATDAERVRLLAAHTGAACAKLGAADAIAEEATAAGAIPSIFDARKLESELQRELARSQRYGRDVSICVIEATNLSLLRERFGTALTDQLYDHLGAELARHARDIDIIGAYKQSGYTMVLAEAAPAGVEAAAQRLAAAARAVGLPGASIPGLELHLAVGWATAPEDGAASEDLFAAAQRRMYGDLTRRVA